MPEPFLGHLQFGLLQIWGELHTPEFTLAGFGSTGIRRMDRNVDPLGSFEPTKKITLARDRSIPLTLRKPITPRDLTHLSWPNHSSHPTGSACGMMDLAVY